MAPNGYRVTTTAARGGLASIMIIATATAAACARTAATMLLSLLLLLPPLLLAPAATAHATTCIFIAHNYGRHIHNPLWIQHSEFGRHAREHTGVVQ